MLTLPPSTIAEYERELLRYWAVTQKDLGHVVNRQALNVTIKAGQQTPVADKSDIESLPQKEWWNKYVAKQIQGDRGVRLGGKKRTHIQGQYTTAQARRVSKRLVQQRKKRAGYTRAGWSGVIKSLAQQKAITRRPTIRGTRNFKNPPGRAIAARAGEAPVATIINQAKGATVVAAAPLSRAVGLASADMRQFIKRQMEPTAKRFNAK